MWLKNKISFFSFLIIILLFSALEAQENNPNSLNKKLNYWQNKSGTEADTNLYSLFYKYGMYYQNENPDSAILMLNQSIIKAKSLNNKLKELESTRQVAWCYYVKEDYPKALSIYSNVIEQVDNLTLSDNEANSYLKLKAGCLGNSGIIFMLQSNYAKALDYYFNALELHEKVGYKKGQASTLGNIGLIYKEQANYEKAYYYYSKSLQIDVEIADKRGQAYNLGNIADFYERKGNYKLALKNYMQVLSISKSLGDKTGEAIALGNIGVVYKADENFPEALSYLENALKLNETLDNKSYQAINLNNIGDIYIKLKKFELANTYLNKAIEVDKFLEAQSGLKDDYFLLHELYLAKANPDEALKAYKQHILYRDSVESSENERASVQKEMQYEFNKKEVLTKAEQEKKDLRQRGIRNFIIVGLVMALIFLVMVFRQRNNIKKEKERSEELLLNILPHEVAEELKQNGEAEAKQHNNVSVLFTDFKGFTQLSEKLSAKELIAELNHCFMAFDKIISNYGIEKIKTIGDAYMAVSGLPIANEQHAENLVKAAFEIRDFMTKYKQERIKQNKTFFEIRLGIHSGDVVAGIVGIKKFAYDVWGDTVNTAARMESSGEVGKVNISEATYQLVKNNFNCEFRGSVEAKGKGKMNMYFVEKIEMIS